MSIGERIKQKRKELRMSADELGRRLGKDRSTIYRYEKGDIEKLPLDILEPIAKALQTTPQYLMGWTETQQKNDVIADIVIRLRTDDEFLSVVELLNNLDNSKISGVKQLLNAFEK
jgi:transcriptional regulator with XRE-family HTH domain